MFVNMNGEDVGKFVVKINNNVVREISGNQGQRWFEEKYDLPANTENKVSIKFIKVESLI